MAAPSSSPAAAPATSAADEWQARTEWFATTPEPWAEIVRLEFGGDRSFASTVNRLVLDAEPGQRAELEAKLIATLGAHGLTDAGRLFVCRMLGLIGTARCVSAVAPLLGDERTADVARIALDGIDDPTVDAAYRAALPKLSGAARSGLSGSLAAREAARAGKKES